MCVIFGTINGEDKNFYRQSSISALARGTEKTEILVNNSYLAHYRTPTNQSDDKYPIIIDNEAIAMNGIVSQREYKRLVNEYGKLDYSLDTAYLLKQIQNKGYDSIDSLDYAFAFWLIQNENIILANKDYPLFIKQYNNILYFSSFKGDGFEYLGNKVISYNTNTNSFKELYQYNNLIYGAKS